MIATPNHSTRNVSSTFLARSKSALKLLHVAAVYGANASGKSNLIAALDAFCAAIVDSAEEGFRWKDKHFRWNPRFREEPTHFEMTFQYDGVHYRYGFVIAKTDAGNGIDTEWLYQATSSRETLLFMREKETTTRGRRFTEGTTLLENKNHLRQTNTLFLAQIAQTGGKIATKITDYVCRHFNILVGGEEKALHDFTIACWKEGKYRDEIELLLRTAGIGAIRITSDEDVDRMQEEIARRKPGTNISPESVRKQGQIIAFHAMYDNSGNEIQPTLVPFALFESSGTAKLFALSGPLFEALASGDVFVIDTLDAQFHPALIQVIIDLFQSAVTNPKNAQLIFTTRDTNLLDSRQLHRDQIWLVEKDRVGASLRACRTQRTSKRQPQGRLHQRTFRRYSVFRRYTTVVQRRVDLYCDGYIPINLLIPSRSAQEDSMDFALVCVAIAVFGAIVQLRKSSPQNF